MLSTSLPFSDGHCCCIPTDRSGELRHRGKEGAEAAEACSVAVGPITGAAKRRANGRGGGARQPAVQRHDEPERVIRRAPEPAARGGQRRRQPSAAVIGGLLRPVLEMTRPRAPYVRLTVVELAQRRGRDL